MKCQETPKPACRCCEDCLREQRERLRDNYGQGYQKPQTSTNRNYENFNEGYYKFEKHSGGGYSQPYNSNYSSKKQTVDANTLSTLSNLRERACKFLGTSDETKIQEENDCKPYFRVKESHPYEGPVRNKTEEIYYEPQSNFLRKMKRRHDVKNTDSDECSPQMAYDISNYFREEEPNYIPYDFQLHSKHSNSLNTQLLPTNKVNVNERATQYCDMTTQQDSCMCYKSWRTKYSDDEDSDDLDFLDDYSEICRQFSEFQGNLEANQKKDQKKDEENGKKVKRRGRSSTRTRKLVRRRRRSRKSNVDSEISFQPSLKKPHPGACDRCWRYASPSRSPVNKPSQRFDPNFRRSHSDMFLNEKGEIKEERKNLESPRQNVANSSHREETKVHHLVSPGSQLDSPIVRSSPGSATRTDKTKSSEDVKKRPSRIRKGEEKEKTSSAIVKRNQSKGDGKSLSVNFEERSDQRGRSPVTSRVSKHVKKPPDSNQPPEETGKGTKSKTINASQRSRSNLKMEKVRAQSVDRKECKNDSKEMPPKQIPTKSPQTISSYQRKNAPSEVKPIVDSTPARPKTATPSLYNTAINRQEDERLNPIHSSEGPPKRGITSNCACCNCEYHRSINPNWSSRDYDSSRYRENIPQEEKKGICKNIRPERSTNIKKESSEMQNNPRKYCVFYMNKSQLNSADDVEVLIEELTQGKSCKDSDESLKEKVRKMKEVRGESMALRFQKGVSHNCRRPENNRVLYF